MVCLEEHEVSVDDTSVNSKFKINFVHKLAAYLKGETCYMANT